MNQSRIVFILVGLSLAVFGAGCSYKATQEIEQAQKAMAQAKEQHAAEFAPTDWKSAEEVWNETQGLIAKERYSQASPLLLKAKSRFEKARDVAKAKRDFILKEVQNAQKTIDLRYKSLKRDIEISAAKLSPARKKSLQDSCSDIDKSIDKIKAELEQGDYSQAKSTAQTTMRRVYETEMELQGYLGNKKS